jgi:hypothetical protein
MVRGDGILSRFFRSGMDGMKFAYQKGAGILID